MYWDAKLVGIFQSVAAAGISSQVRPLCATRTRCDRNRAAAEAPANGADRRPLITSDNPAYPQISIPAKERDQVHIIGRAVWAGRRL